MLTALERAALKEFGNQYAAKVVNAIKTKPIQRYTERMGAFSSVVNASGRLASSVNVKELNDGVGVYSLEYINSLIYGKEPSFKAPSVNDIKSWQKAKGVGGSASSIARSIAKNGSSIWQKFKGQNSGLLDFDYSQEYGAMAKTILNSYGNLVTVNMKELQDAFK